MRKRRRPGRKLVAAEGLVRELGAVLDGIAGEEEEEDEDGWSGIEEDEDEVMDGEVGREDAVARREERKAALKANRAKTRLRSLRTRPGALRRKERIVRSEKTRFEANWAGLAGGTSAKQEEVGGKAAAQPSSTADRWAALRGFITTTMEQNPAFVGRGTGANAS